MRHRPTLGPQDYRGLFAIVPTPARATGNPWADRSTVDLDELARLCDSLITAGAGGIIGLGTTGECATLGSHEYESVARTMIESVGGRAPVFIGATALGWAETATRLTILGDAGADGTLLGLPMWQPMTEEMAVSQFAHVSSAFPELTAMVYANERAFRFPFATSPTFWRRLVDEAPTVTSAKFSRPDAFERLRSITDGHITLLPNEMRMMDFVAIAGQQVQAFWATSASMGPEPCLALADAVSTSDYARAQSVAADLAWANEPVESLIRNQEIFASYNIQIEKSRINAAGYCAAGPVRPPYDVLPAQYASQAAECGRRWRDLRARYAGASCYASAR